MHHDENNPRHSQHNKEMRHRREHHPNHERERYFNDFKSRWGEPSPPLNLHQNERDLRELGRFEREGRYHQQHEEWLPNQQRRPQPPRNENQPRDISWRQRDVNFDRNNQRVEDRWQQDDTIPHPREKRRRRQGPSDEYGYDERNRR